MFVIVHSGQTGVERGAHHGALAAGFSIAGFMAANGRDELGSLPDHVASYLQPSAGAGPRGAIRANLAISDAALIVVPDAKTAVRFPAMDWILRDLRMRSVPFLICDPETTPEQAATWAARLTGKQLLVTGPRATRWQAGEEVARRLVRSLAAE